MPTSADATPGLTPVDAAAADRRFAAAAEAYGRHPVVRELVGRLLERLEPIRLSPRRILDLGAGPGVLDAALQARYPQAQRIALDRLATMLRAGGEGTARGWRVQADARRIPLASASVDLVIAAMLLPWALPLDALLAECRRVLAPGGLLVLSAPGPDTLRELRQAWAAADPAPTHVHDAIDLHDIGDALVRAGFADPVMDMEMLELRYVDLAGLKADLAAGGVRNARADRPQGLTGRRGHARLRAAYEAMRHEGRLPATLELIHGHAWVPGEAQAPVEQGVVRVSLEALRSRLRRR
ncbi:MAG: methyltransferase domain-containing protein [Pseudomonadota bacterium]|nr:methyltransferase domain-containing protein [Pseudomonadota bacterium]HJO36317.1 methyltransferase domain-containing protein [Gammaproteobacteria bacterium]